MSSSYFGKVLVFNHITKTPLHHSRQSSILFVPILFYLCLISLTKFSTVPLRSVSTIKSIDFKDAINRQVEEDNFKNYQSRGASAQGDRSEPYFTLEEIFHKADSSNDGYLSIEEVSAWIYTKTQEHIHNAIMENYGLFTAIDVQPRNGIITWDEYHSFFLRKQGLSNQYVKNHNERHVGLSRDVKETIMRDKAAWTEAAKSDPNHLTLDEFLAFRHPESSHSTILALVEEMLDKFDRDGDDILTEDEFSSLDIDNVNEKTDIQVEGESERRREFREAVDQDNNGKATRKELMFYMDPKNPRHAKEEAETLVALADMDHDGKLSLREVFNKIGLFLGSKMVDIGRSFHDEF